MKQNENRQYKDYDEEYERSYERRRKNREKKNKRGEWEYDHIEENEED